MLKIYYWIVCHHFQAGFVGKRSFSFVFTLKHWYFFLLLIWVHSLTEYNCLIFKRLFTFYMSLFVPIYIISFITVLFLCFIYYIFLFLFWKEHYHDYSDSVSVYVRLYWFLHFCLNESIYICLTIFLAIYTQVHWLFTYFPIFYLIIYSCGNIILITNNKVHTRLAESR